MEHSLCAVHKAAVWTPTYTHMLNATYIWYSSMASTNWPQESKSVAFLKLACHFWTILVTSDMVAGRIQAALSEQHIRWGRSSTGIQLWLQRQQRRSRQPSSPPSRGAHRPVTARPSPFWPFIPLSHPQHRGSPAWRLQELHRGARCGTRGLPIGRQREE